VDNASSNLEPFGTQGQFPVDFNFWLYLAAGQPSALPVENYVGKESRTLIPGIPQPNLFIDFQESLIGKEWRRGRFAQGPGRATGRAPSGESPVFSFLTALYPWTKVLHIFAVIAWMAGLLYLPRLFVYHAERGAPGSELGATFAVMERRLLRGIMNPAMVATWVFGLALALTPGLVDWRADHWFHVKLALVAGLTWFHHWLARRRKDFVAGRNTVTARRFRMVNELPAVALLVILIMVVVRPF
jgi:protoporphyrinogen IX oxidase